MYSRSPHGERGLKSKGTNFDQVTAAESLPARGAWIEMHFPVPHAACGRGGRSPHGERGLKSKSIGAYPFDVPVAPRTGRGD